jgi:phosphomannomutase
MNKKIKFGTDGWRGIIGFDFTTDKIEMITSGICRYLKNKNSSPKVVIGYDTRFLSNKFAEISAKVFGKANIKTYLSDDFITTPVISAAVVKNNADLGIMITASHNPYYYNGYKIKGSYGGSATLDIVGEIENCVNSLNMADFQSTDTSYPSNKNSSYNENIEVKNFVPDYKKLILDLVDAGVIQNFDFSVLLDPMYGASQDIFSGILENFSPGKIVKIHSSINPAFGGINPEPIGDNLNEAIAKLKDSGCKLAICLDGDGDRIGALGEDGNFISSHHIFAIVLNYLLNYKKLSGKVVKTVSTSSIIDRICSKYGLELIIKPIGFKYISEEILSGGVIMGGEESGGLWVQGYIPERDGILMGLILLEILCRAKKSANEILNEIYNEFGYFVYRRLDYEMDIVKREKIKEVLTKGIPEILKSKGVVSVVTIDGFKYILEDGSWLMIRPSGTEAVVRIYGESDTEEKLSKLHELGKSIIA